MPPSWPTGCCARPGRCANPSSRPREPGEGPRVHARDHARLQQLAALLGDGRGGPLAAGRGWDRDARRLRAAPARAVVQGRRGVRGRSRLPLGLLQQLRHPADAARRARRLRRPVAGVAGHEGRRGGARSATRPCSSGSISPEGTFPAIGRSIAYRFGALQLLAQMALRRDLPAGGGARPGPRRPHRRDPPLDRGPGHVRRRRAGCASASAATSPASASATSPRAASTCARSASCPWACPRATPSGRARPAVDGETRLVGPELPDRQRALRVLTRRFVRRRPTGPGREKARGPSRGVRRARGTRPRATGGPRPARRSAALPSTYRREPPCSASL